MTPREKATYTVVFKCEGCMGADWLSPHHTRCEACGHIREDYSIGLHVGHNEATAAAEAKHAGVVGLLREWYDDANLDIDDGKDQWCFCDSMKDCDGTCLFQRTRQALAATGDDDD